MAQVQAQLMQCTNEQLESLDCTQARTYGARAIAKHARADGETFTICALSHDRTSTHVTPTQIVSRPAERPLSDGRAAAHQDAE